MARDVFIFVNGILTRPGNAKGWTDRAVHWVNRRLGDAAAYPFEYYSPVLLRFLFQGRHATNLAETLAEYPADRLHLVGHSNGCELIRRAVLMTSAQIASLHWLSAATDADLVRSGLDEPLARRQVGALFCYCSRGDLVLKYLAPASRVATLGLAGYGDLGHVGASATAPNVHHLWREDLGHGDWFDPAHFESTMRAISDRALVTSLALP